MARMKKKKGNRKSILSINSHTRFFFFYFERNKNGESLFRNILMLVASINYLGKNISRKIIFSIYDFINEKIKKNQI